jgi:hypothetical protein
MKAKESNKDFWGCGFLLTSSAMSTIFLQIEAAPTCTTCICGYYGIKTKFPWSELKGLGKCDSKLISKAARSGRKHITCVSSFF